MTEMVEPAFENSKPVVHAMIPGSHERGHGAECRCGASWDRWNDECVKRAGEMKEFRDLNFGVTFGADKGYLAVENNFSSFDFSFASQEDIKNSVTLDIDDLRKLISALHIMADGFEKFGKKA
jgi:hypothetical protein